MYSISIVKKRLVLVVVLVVVDYGVDVFCGC